MEQPQGQDVGQRLIERGWRQGSLIPGVGRVHFERGDDGTWQTRERDPNEGERLIVVSQECDILATSESFVEAMPSYWVRSGSRQFSAGRTGNSGRYFLLREDGVSKQRRALIVDATDRVQIGKPSLLGIEPEFAVPVENAGVFSRRFRGWLGGRYSRVPLDPAVVTSIQRPISELIQELSKDAALDPTLLVREIRMAPVHGAPPFDLHLIVLVPDGVSATDAPMAHLVGALDERFASASDGTRLVKAAVRTTDKLLVADYEDTWKIPLDHDTWKGEEEIGAPPVRGIEHG